MTDYYVANAPTGNDANNGTSELTPWETLDKADDGPYNPNDSILLKKGEEWREQWTAPSPGSSGNPITLSTYGNGDSPIVNGSDLVVTWSDEGSNVWSANFAPNGIEADPRKVFFDGTLGTKVADQGSINFENEWYYDNAGDILYIYSISDPDTAFTNPGIEALSEDWCILVDDKNYITVDGIDCSMGNQDCIKVTGTSQNTIIKNLTVNYAGQNGYLESQSAGNTYLYNVIAHDNGTVITTFGFWMGAPTAIGDFLIESCVAYNNFGPGFGFWEGGGGTIKYCQSHDNYAGYDVSDPADDADFAFYYCIAWDNSDRGLRIVHTGDTYNGNNTFYIYNYVAYSGDYHGIHLDDNHADTEIIVKNSILMQDHVALYVSATGAGGSLILDHNCYYRASGTMIYYEDTSYNQAQFATYQSAKSQDANSISADPLFADAPNDDFTLQVGSPCINAGVDVGLTQDFVGTTVPQGPAPDMGAYEYIYPTRTLVSVRIVTASELKVNGGRFTLRQGPAIKVRGYKLVEAGATKIKGGDAQPIYILADTDIKSGGGRWKVNAGPVILVTDVIGDERGVIQGNAIPVYPVDDDGDFDPTFAI